MARTLVIFFTNFPDQRITPTKGDKADANEYLRMTNVYRADICTIRMRRFGNYLKHCLFTATARTPRNLARNVRLIRYRYV